MNLTIRRHLWQVLWWPRFTVKRGVWPRQRRPIVFRWWIIGPIEVRQYVVAEPRQGPADSR